MTRVHEVIRRYEACRAIVRGGAEVVAVGDPAGAQLNAGVRRMLFELDDDRKEVWGDLLRVASALRWRRMTQPQPNAYGPATTEAIEGVQRQVRMLDGFVSDEPLLDQLSSAAAAIGGTDSPVGTELLRSIIEFGVQDCLVVADNVRARAGLRDWLGRFGVRVVVPSELQGLSEEFERSYLVGPPVFFTPSLVTAPVTQELTFIMPSWYPNRAIPSSSFSDHAEGARGVRARVHEIGDVVEELPETAEAAVADVYYPQPSWGLRASDLREPKPDEVEAWKVLLGGGLGLWLDDGERIRSFDPRQPVGERVSYEAIENVRPGSYLVLREGESEHGAMHRAAMQAVGDGVASISETQDRWKRLLAERLEQHGCRRVIEELKDRNVRTASRVRAWVEPSLICPKYEGDFALLLDWLTIPQQPSHGNALRLRRALYKASADLRQQLESAVARTDLGALERDGFIHLDLQREGIRGMVIARVLARAPFTEIVPRGQTRVVFQDGGAQWLE